MKKTTDSRFEREQSVRLLAMRAGDRGITWHDVSRAWRSNHGVVSSFLSQMHKENKIVRLKNKRGNSSIYVLQEHVMGRTTVPHGRNLTPCQHCGKLPYKVDDSQTTQ